MAEHSLLQLLSPQQLNEICHASLTEKEYQNCIKKSQLLNPAVGKLWTQKDISPGLYIVVSGKIRLLDNSDEMIVALGAGNCFGEYTFFPTVQLTTYTARAGIDVQICFIPQEVLNLLIEKYPTIHQQLWQLVQERCTESKTDRYST
jgi:CRP-like cAMP-binding protein